MGVLIRRPGPVALALTGCAVAYAAGLHALSGTGRALSVVGAAAGLLVVGELGFDGVGHGRSAIRAGDRSGDRGRRWAWLAGCALGAAVCAFVVLGIGAIAVHRTALVTLGGALAAVLAVGLVVVAVRRGLAAP